MRSIYLKLVGLKSLRNSGRLNSRKSLDVDRHSHLSPKFLPSTIFDDNISTNCYGFSSSFESSLEYTAIFLYFIKQLFSNLEFEKNK